MTSPEQALERLRGAARSGELEERCRRLGVRVLTVFGSAASGDSDPGDLDIGIMFEPDRDGDILATMNALIELTGSEAIDVMDAQRASPVARARAMVEALPLYESEPGAYAQAQMAAALLEWDTAWLRRMALDSLAR